MQWGTFKDTLRNLSYQEVIASDLKNFANFETVIKLKAIMATLTHKESEVCRDFWNSPFNAY